MRLLKRVLTPALLALALFATACGGSDVATATDTTADEATAAVATTEPVATTAPTEEPAAQDPTAVPADEDPTAVPADEPTTVPADATTTASGSTATCEDIAAVFVTKGSANPSFVDPEVNATCAGDTLTVTGNGIPDYTYIETSPGDPRPQDLEYVIPAVPTATSDYTDVPVIGPVAVAINGIPIYGPTEGQGADVLSLGGGLSECGSHNGPGGFHIHLFSTSETTDCIYTPAEVAEAPQLFGYAFDGYPIYTGNDQYTSSWELTDESLFATDTWAAHSYVAGSGDLDQCNGLTDANGDYAYYTTDTFPYVIGCFAGEVEITGPGEGGGGGGGGDDARPPRDDDAAAPAGDDGPPPGDGEGAAPAEGQGQGGGDEGAGPAGGQGGGQGQGQGQGQGGGADFTEAAATLGVTLEELQAALGDSRPPDFDAAAAALGITLDELMAVLPAPPG